MGKILFDSPIIEKATTQKTTVNYPSRKKGRNNLNSPDFVFGAIATDNEYNSYFKLVLVTEQNGENTQYKVAVVDGATYDPATHSSDTMACKVNDMSFYVPPFITDEAIKKNTLFLLKFTAPAETNNNVGFFEIVIDKDSLPHDSNTECFFQIGRAIMQDGAVQIAQDWTGGVPQIFWFTSC